jgi:fatty acid desaturase
MTKHQEPTTPADGDDKTPPQPRFAGASTATLPPTIEGEHGPGRAPGDPDSPNPLHRLSPEEIENIGKAFEAIHDAVKSDLGERDTAYIRNLITFQRRLSVMSRSTLMASRYPPAWILGTAGLSVAKIIENMELGHNILHGQWDWMNDPKIHSSTWDWDNVSTAAGWKHSHNVIHHTYTNILGKDKDIGYEVMRVSPKQRWSPEFLAQPFLHAFLMAFFEWGVAFHDLDWEAIQNGTKDKKVLKRELKEIAQKAGKQMLKDYVLFPALSGKAWKKTLAANFVANIARNAWATFIIFCGHFPDQAYTFTESEVAGETRGAWYVRQLLGSVNIEGGDAFHLMSGNLSYQIEHHLFPDMPSSRYKEIAPKVKAVCEEYGLPYNSGPFLQQWLMVQRSILRYTFPGGGEKDKQGPYVAPPVPEAVVPTVDGVDGPIVAFP